MRLYIPSLLGRGTRATSERINAELTKIATALDGAQAAIDALSVGASLPSFTWTAWADSLDGTANFTTVAPGNRTHIGTSTNRLTPDPSQNPEDYVWARFVGRDGDDGGQAQPLIVQWSVNGVDGWHDAYAVGDRFQRSSVDGGQTFGPAVRVVGEAGETVRFAYRRALNQPTTPPNTGADVPAGWSDAPPVDDGTSLWQTQAEFQGPSQLTDWREPVRLVSGGVTDNADETATNTHRLTDVAEVIVGATYQGVVSAGQLPRYVEIERFLGIINRSADATWTLEIPQGVTASINNTSGSDQRGEVTITGLTAAEAQLVVVSVLDGVELRRNVTIRRSDAAAPQPAPGGGGGGAPGNPATDSTLTPIGTSFTHVPISDWLAVVVGSSGTVNLGAPVSYACGNTGNIQTDEAEYPYVIAATKWVYSADGVGNLSDIGPEEIGTEAVNHYDTTNKRRINYSGNVSCTRVMTGLTPGATAYFRLFGRIYDAFRPPSNGIVSNFGTATAAPQ